MVTSLVAAGLVAALVLAGRHLYRAYREITLLRRELTGSTRLMARINVELARELFERGDFAAAARFEELATRLETVAEDPAGSRRAASPR
ncbi:MAG TPA: hypothetical protein VHC18_11840 [Amycolatopsis sp.]|nr:hypothetical protein [Amycolatopsis sp.]